MKKRLISGITAAAMFIGVFSGVAENGMSVVASAESFGEADAEEYEVLVPVAPYGSNETVKNGFVLKTDSDGFVYVDGYTGKGGDVTVPDEVDYIYKMSYYKIKYKYASSASISAKSLSAPSSVKAVGGNGKVSLSWEKVKGADGYVVYIYNSSAKKYQMYKAVQSSKCVVSGLKNGTSYSFKVAAYVRSNGKNVVGQKSKAVTVKSEQ
ncbi:MAG: fibronectin type III domain-containing protein [Oscillospiraceae bacterium]